MPPSVTNDDAFDLVPGMVASTGDLTLADLPFAAYYDLAVLGLLLRDAGIPVAWGQTLARDPALPAEWWSLLAREFGLLPEWTALVGREGTAPVSWRGGLDREGALPLEWSQGLGRDDGIPVEWAGVAALIREGGIPVEWLSPFLAREVRIPVEWPVVLPDRLRVIWDTLVLLEVPLPVRWTLLTHALAATLAVQWEVRASGAALPVLYRVVPDVVTPFADDIQRPTGSVTETP